MTWDELSELLSDSPPPPKWMLPLVEQWAADFKSEAGKARLAAIKEHWDSEVLAMRAKKNQSL